MMQNFSFLTLSRRSRRARRGQSTIEMAILIVVAAGALATMAVYMKRAVAGKLRVTADSIGSQYAPRHTTSTFTTQAMSDVVSLSALVPIQGTLNGQPVTGSALRTVTTTNQDTTTRTGAETVEPLTNDLWQ